MSIDTLDSKIEYEHQARVVRPEGLIGTSDLIMKIYSMLQKEYSVNIQDAKDFIMRKIAEKEIQPRLSGMGFVIVSENVLNSTVWGSVYSILGKTDVYFFEGDIKSAIKQDLNNEGAYCAFEAQILGFEGSAWIEYLRSEQTSKDKQKYFESWFVNTLNP